MQDITLPAGVTAEKMKDWKAKYGLDADGSSNVYVIAIRSKKDKSVFRCVVRNPDEKILGMALPWMEKNPAKMCKILISNCFLGGDEIIKEHYPYALQAGGKLAEYLDQAEAEIENF